VTRSAKAVGRAMSHESAAGHVTGGAKYVDDLPGELGRVAHAWPVVAPHAHARVQADSLARAGAQARACPGVLRC
jgi:xanthine dehydrogenase large subunit